ncbi:hypothetical protein T484DRAFT_1945160, partial [Baffinella frigidus]
MNRDLKEGMVLTIAPGCYLIPSVLEPAFKDEAKVCPILQQSSWVVWICLNLFEFV